MLASRRALSSECESVDGSDNSGGVGGESGGSITVGVGSSSLSIQETLVDGGDLGRGEGTSSIFRSKLGAAKNIGECESILFVLATEAEDGVLFRGVGGGESNVLSRGGFEVSEPVSVDSGARNSL